MSLSLYLSLSLVYKRSILVGRQVEWPLGSVSNVYFYFFLPRLVFFVLFLEGES